MVGCDCEYQRTRSLFSLGEAGTLATYIHAVWISISRSSCRFDGERMVASGPVADSSVVRMWTLDIRLGLLIGTWCSLLLMLLLLVGVGVGWMQP